jgi:hypothetical protein
VASTVLNQGKDQQLSATLLQFPIDSPSLYVSWRYIAMRY